jgi:uncharacterized protein (TIGR02266 family)
MYQWRVLLAEDEALMAQMAMDMLSELPLQILVARDGKEALEQAVEALPDLILLDAMMPEMDGFQVAAALKENPATHDIPIIFMTARTRIEDKVRGLDLGAEDYLVKPIRREELLARVRNVLRRTESRRATAPVETSLMRGRLDAMSLPNIVQMIEMERRSGTLNLSAEGRQGQILFREGQILGAVQGPRRGDPAVYALCTWPRGEFAFRLATSEVSPDLKTSRSNQSLMMEGARRLDELTALRQSCAALTGSVQLFAHYREALLGRELPAGVHHVVELCDGSHPVAQIVDAASLDEWGTLTVLDRFLRLGMLEQGPSAKRAFPRLSAQMPVEFQSLKAFQRGASSDISSRGVFLRTAQVFPVGEDLVLQFKLPGLASAIRLLGRVVWSSSVDTPQGLPAGMGVQFLEVSGEEQRTIDRCIVLAVLGRAVQDLPEL